MQKENLMETVVSVVAPAPVEPPASDLAADESAVPDRSVPAALPAVCTKTVARLDALKEYVLGYIVPHPESDYNCPSGFSVASRPSLFATAF